MHSHFWLFCIGALQGIKESNPLELRWLVSTNPCWCTQPDKEGGLICTLRYCPPIMRTRPHDLCAQVHETLKDACCQQWSSQCSNFNWTTVGSKMIWYAKFKTCILHPAWWLLGDDLKSFALSTPYAVYWVMLLFGVSDVKSSDLWVSAVSVRSASVPAGRWELRESSGHPDPRSTTHHIKHHPSLVPSTASALIIAPQNKAVDWHDEDRSCANHFYSRQHWHRS